MRIDQLPKNPKEIILFVARHLLTQKEQSMCLGACAYRGLNGRTCAVGVLIPDELYSPEFEDKRVGEVLFMLGVETEHTDLLQRLQYIHDLPSKNHDRLLNLAREYNCISDIEKLIEELA